ncbi:hypothetical protein [Sphingobium sp. HWE2-09]|uniref:hypothetical protein n=1 Tax=Sphingobium sp. HWE2-09 TaxID=3108390 RepID=UPI002DC39252|nr:hypothetical protein [Sphingobium sp. HWE2-09]
MTLYRKLVGGLILLGVTSPIAAQDYNYVPGWANTHNHRYQGEKSGEWEAKTVLFRKLASAGPDAACTLKHLPEPDGNVIVNRYRSLTRKTNEPAALRWAHGQVAIHHRQMKAVGKC